MAILAQDLVTGQSLVTVGLNHTIEYAYQIMIEGGYNQLPVVDEYNKPLGIITAGMIAQAIFELGTRIQTELISRIGYGTAPMLAHSRDVLNQLEILRNPSVILSFNEETGELSSIVTSKDTSDFFRQKSEELIHLRFIDKSLREYIHSKFWNKPEFQNIINDAVAAMSSNQNYTDVQRHAAREAVVEFCRNKDIILRDDDLKNAIDKVALRVPSVTFEDLSFEGLIKLIELNYQLFKSSFGFSAESWSGMMDGIMQTRDKVLNLKHEISSSEKRALRSCADWCAKHSIAPESSVAPSTATLNHDIYN